MSSSETDRPGHSDISLAPCGHKRVIDYVVSKDGERTGNFICKECGAILPAEKEPPDQVVFESSPDLSRSAELRSFLSTPADEGF